MEALFALNFLCYCKKQFDSLFSDNKSDAIKCLKLGSETNRLPLEFWTMQGSYYDTGANLLADI